MFEQIKSDLIIFDRNESSISADGNIILNDTDGNTYFLDHLESDTEINNLKGNEIKVRLDDGSRIVGSSLVKKDKISLMRYETNSCIYSQASASILANSINLFNKNNLTENIKILNSHFADKKLKMPLKLKKFQYFFNKKI